MHPDAMRTIEEEKRHLNKPPERFTCLLLRAEPDHAVLWYCAPRPGAVRDILLPAGTCTIAHYWRTRTYVLWSMLYPGGARAGTLLHLCSDVSLTPERISYLDLIVDIWINPDGAVRILDQDELEACVAAGLVSREEQRRIAAHTDALIAARDRLLAEAERDTAHFSTFHGAHTV